MLQDIKFPISIKYLAYRLFKKIERYFNCDIKACIVFGAYKKLCSNYLNNFFLISQGK